MTNGVILLGGITLVMAGDMVLGLYYRSVADRVESGDPVAPKMRAIDPAQTRWIGTMLIVSAPLIWLVCALFAFGVIPSGIEPIKF